MAESSTARTRHLMPGTFESGEPIDQNENPFELLIAIQESWRQRDHGQPWSTHKLPVLNLAGISWHDYNAPAALYKTPNVTSQILRDIVASSIDNIKEQAVQAAERRREEEQQQAEGTKLKNTEAEPYLPIIIRARPPTPPPEPEAHHELDAGISSGQPKDSDEWSTRRAELIHAVSNSQSPEPSVRSDKSRKSKFRKLFGRSGEKPEKVPMVWDPATSRYRPAPKTSVDRGQPTPVSRRGTGSSKATGDMGTTVTWDPTTGQYKRRSLQSNLSPTTSVPTQPVEPVIELV